MTAPPPCDPLIAQCPRPWCRQPAGRWCVTARLTLAGRLHAPRVRLSLGAAAGYGVPAEAAEAVCDVAIRTGVPLAARGVLEALGLAGGAE